MGPTDELSGGILGEFEAHLEWQHFKGVVDTTKFKLARRNKVM
jgi:hypothetical protein